MRENSITSPLNKGRESLFPDARVEALAHLVMAVRGHDQGALIRVLTFNEARSTWSCCGWWDRADGGCEAVPVFRLATPHGHQDFCRDHVDYMLASLPPEWVGSWGYREPLAMEEQDDLPF